MPRKKTIEEKLTEERDDLKKLRVKKVNDIAIIDERIKKIDAFIGEELKPEQGDTSEA